MKFTFPGFIYGAAPSGIPIPVRIPRFTDPRCGKVCRDMTELYFPMWTYNNHQTTKNEDCEAVINMGGLPRLSARYIRMILQSDILTENEKRLQLPKKKVLWYEMARDRDQKSIGIEPGHFPGSDTFACHLPWAGEGRDNDRSTYTGHVLLRTILSPIRIGNHL